MTREHSTSLTSLATTGKHDKVSAMTLSSHQSKFYAHQLERSYASDHVGKLAGLLFDAQVEPKPHQIDAALFALQASSSPGVILADEVGLGKTIEAGIVLSQYWAERKRRILIVAPSSLRQQWQQELSEKFALPSRLLDGANKHELLQPQAGPPQQILICSYEFVLRHLDDLSRHWDVVVADEAHRLRSHWKPDAKIAQAAALVMQSAGKSVLLTATPLQNRLEELYGLVSVFDPNFFHSIEGFKERYVDDPGGYGNDDLAMRISHIAKRTLRKDAQKYIRFTERIPMAFEFTPSHAEIELYDKVNEYLQRPVLHAFASSQRHLSALILRKRLGSSTYAVASTLERVANRLEAEVFSGQIRSNSGALIDDDMTGEELEATDEALFASGTEASSDEIFKEMETEVAELRSYASLAKSITVNQKAVKLIDALAQGFSRLSEIGAAQKAIIFTDSTKTQEYLARALAEAGHGEGLVLFNGQNDSDQSKRIYREWLDRNEGSDLITGIHAADRRKALVDEFRKRGTIMIATEAAAEGINLQFCSMLVNYDLPWNPQRVEQRIGRVHRYGQKHNVVVVNFSNKGNLAEERILVLLSEKFQLFTSVFGASDEVLGSIEDGLDFEKSIAAILERCKTADEINHAFDELELMYQVEIGEEMAKARARVFDNLDPNVQDKLKSYDAQKDVVLNTFERLLLQVTRHELRGVADFEGDGRHFTLHSTPDDGIQTGRYFFKSSPQQGAHQYRYNSELGQYVVSSALTSPTPEAELVFSLADSERVSAAVRQLADDSGVLTAELLTFTIRTEHSVVTESYILAAGMSDQGEAIDAELVEQILDLACIESKPDSGLNNSALQPILQQQAELVTGDVQNRTAQYSLDQSDLIESRLKDHRAKWDAAARKLEKSRDEVSARERKAADLSERLKLRKEIQKLSRRADDLYQEFRDERDRLRANTDKYLAMLEDSLNGEESREHIFTIRWRVRQ